MKLRHLFIFVAAGVATSAWSQDLPPEENRLQPDHLPTPFSAAAIREASPGGLTTCHLIVGPDRAPVRSINTFVGHDAEVARFRHRSEDEQGNPSGEGEPQTAEASWTQLQSHASFPVERATVEVAMIEIPLGRFECWLYTVKGVAGAGPGTGAVETRFWFAQTMPGPPVKLERRVNGEVTMTMTLVSRETT